MVVIVGFRSICVLKACLAAAFPLISIAASAAPEREGAAPIDAVSYPAEYSGANKLTLVEGELVPLSLYFYGDKAKVDDVDLVVSTPKGATLKYAFCPNYWTEPPIELKYAEREVDGCSQYRIQLDVEHMKKRLPAKPDCFDPTSVCLLLEAAPGFKGNGELSWRLDVKGMKGPDRRLSLNAVKLRSAAVPAYFKQYSYCNGLLKAPSEEIRKRLVGLYKRLGVYGCVINSKEVASAVSSDLEVVVEFSTGFWGGGWWGVGYDEMNKGGVKCPTATLRNGAPAKRKDAMCQSSLIENHGTYVKRLQANMRKLCFNGSASAFMNDYELDIFSDIAWTNSCFCPRCKAEFAKFAGVDAGEIATASADEILKSRKARWIDFRYWQNGQIVKYYNAAVKGIDPSLKTILCSVGVGSGDRGKVYHPIDPVEYDEFVDAHWPMFYTQSSEYFDQVDNAAKKLKKPVIPCVTTVFPVGERNVWRPWLLKLNMLATAACGGKGVCHFPGVSAMDGEYFNALVDADGLLSLAGRFYSDGRRTDENLKLEPLAGRIGLKGDSKVYEGVSTGSFIRWTAHASGSDRLVSIFNYHSEAPVYLHVCVSGMRGGLYSIRDLATGVRLVKADGSARWSAGELEDGIAWKAGPGGAGLLLISQSPDDGAGASMEIREDFIKGECMKMGRSASGAADSSRRKSAAWSSDGIPESQALAHGATAVKKRWGTTYAFDGKGAYIEIPANDLPVLHGPFTLEFLIFPENLPQDRSVDFIRKDGGFNIFMFHNINVIPCDIFSKGERIWSDNRNFLTPGRWSHVAVVSADGYLRTYHDGREIGQCNTGVMDVDNTPTPMSISSLKHPFHGRMSRIRIYDGKLDGQDVWRAYLDAVKSL